MAKSETCLINLSYQDGSEGSPSNPAKFKNQDFAQIKADYIRKGGQLFEDNEFPPNGRSLGDLPDMSPSEESGVKWLRPADLLREQGKKDKPAFCTDGMSRFDFGQGKVEACKDFTGGVNQIYHPTEANAPSCDELWLTLSRATKCKSLICCGTLHKKDALANTGLVDGHAYSVTGITEVELNGSKVRLLRVMNPWGKQEWNGKWSDKSDLWDKVSPEVRKKCCKRNDGELWMQMEDFCSYFAKVSICCETPNFLDGDLKCQWNCRIYDGSWVAGKSAGGDVNHPSFATNPQYRIRVTVIDKKEPGDKNIVLSLMEKPQQGNRKEIRLDRYGLNIYKTPQGRLQQDFFQRNSPVKAEKTYSSERDHIELHSLETGEYVIIPSTYKPNITADFALAVYTKTDK
ncbi:unnamed protein product [Oreochromis niloticus]|nr:unnamed protein product [Mustela putorius furo]